MSKTYPSGLYNFLVAESVRQEVSGKVTIIGAFSIGKIIVPPDSLFPLALPLAFFIAFKDGEGNFDAKLRITDPNKTVLEPVLSFGSVVKERDQAMQLLVNMPTFPVARTGDFIVDVMLDSRVYQEHFSVNFVGSEGSVH